MSTTQNKKASSGLEIAAILTIAGGALDAYTYACRGGVFANAQTGNIIRLGIFLANGNYSECILLMISIAAFGLGTFTALIIQKNFYKIREKSARRFILLIEMLVVIAVAFIPHGDTMNTIANALISFMAAMQMEAFKTFSGQTMTTTVSTGNYRKLIEYVYQGIENHDVKCCLIAFQYALVIFFFIAGGFMGLKLALWTGIRSVLFELIPLSLVFMIITIKTNNLKPVTGNQKMSLI